MKRILASVVAIAAFATTAGAQGWFRQPTPKAIRWLPYTLCISDHETGKSEEEVNGKTNRDCQLQLGGNCFESPS